MKAIVIKEFAQEPSLERRELADLIPQAQEVRVQVRAIGLNQADLLQCRGHYPAPPGCPPNIPGLEFAGIIDEVGEHVSDYFPGERVFGLIAGGAFAEAVTVHYQCVTKIPDSLSFVEAAAIPEVFLTAYDALITQMKLSMGESLLISAIGGGVGLAALQLAKIVGCTVIGSSRSREKLDKARDLGVEHGILVEEGRFASALKTIVPDGVDVILELVGGDYLTQDISCSALNGRIIIVGLLGGKSTNIDLGKVLAKRLLLKGTTMRARPLAEKIIVNQILKKNITPLLVEKKLHAVIDKIFHWSEAAEALQYIGNGANFGKVVLSLI